jgi:hypothetical protein
MSEDGLPYYPLNWKPKHGKRSRGRHLNDIMYIEDAEEKLKRSVIIKS